MSGYRNAGQNHNTKIANRSFANVWEKVFFCDYVGLGSLECSHSEGAEENIWTEEG
jgi:hypothetical protein